MQELVQATSSQHRSSEAAPGIESNPAPGIESNAGPGIESDAAPGIEVRLLDAEPAGRAVEAQEPDKRGSVVVEDDQPRLVAGIQ